MMSKRTASKIDKPVVRLGDDLSGLMGFIKSEIESLQETSDQVNTVPKPTKTEVESIPEEFEQVRASFCTQL